MRALVTGATGFVGSHLVDALQRRGATVTALARSAEKAASLTSQGIRVVAGHLHDETALLQAARDQDVVYHVAGVVAARNEAEFLRANRDGTKHVVAAAESAGTRNFVLVSSLAAGGPSPRGLALDGSEPPRPVTSYGKSKLASEEVVRSSRLQWSIVRPPMVYGPRDREVLKVFRLVRYGIAPLFGDGTQELSAIHAADLANALVLASEAPTGKTYVACHPEIFTSEEFARVIGRTMKRSVRTLKVPPMLGRALLSVTEATARLTGQTTILTADKANEFFQAAWTGDPTPLISDTGWQPGYDLQAGMADTYHWYRKAGWL
ncbi:MAG TPA: NAD(P)-dependent oxidoreductase [Gemmatimonadales bacterium]|jgi:nucleoside-diphosphate-sugar epimerase|nr:NAD(P)-dependent oxidoreductase [Gemmatimonadales bacterium]